MKLYRRENYLSRIRGFKSIKTPKQLEEVIDKSCTAEGIKYLFIDEIQNVENFEEVINAYREEDEYSIFITGSNYYLSIMDRY